MEFLTPIIRKSPSPFPVLWAPGGIFYFYSNFNGIFCKQIVETLVRRRVLWRLIWVCTVCLCPTKRTMWLYGLICANLEIVQRWERNSIQFRHFYVRDYLKSTELVCVANILAYKRIS